MSDKPEWKWGWTEFTERRLEKEATRLCTLAEKYEDQIATVKYSLHDLGQGLNTDAGDKLSSYVSELCAEAEQTAQQMRDAAQSIRNYNARMLTLWEAFQIKLKEWEEALTE